MKKQSFIGVVRCTPDVLAFKDVFASEAEWQAFYEDFDCKNDPATKKVVIEASSKKEAKKQLASLIAADKQDRKTMKEQDKAEKAKTAAAVRRAKKAAPAPTPEISDAEYEMLTGGVEPVTEAIVSPVTVVSAPKATPAPVVTAPTPAPKSVAPENAPLFHVFIEGWNKAGAGVIAVQADVFDEKLNKVYSTGVHFLKNVDLYGTPYLGIVAAAKHVANKFWNTNCMFRIYTGPATRLKRDVFVRYDRVECVSVPETQKYAAYLLKELKKALDIKFGAMRGSNNQFVPSVEVPDPITPEETVAVSKAIPAAVASAPKVAPTPAPKKTVAVIYTDGSHNKATDIAGWAYSIVGGPSDKGSLPANGSAQIGGELKAVVEGLREAYRQGYRSVEINYDYTGIEKWAVGAWKANKDLTRGYVADINAAKAIMNVSFKKVAAHTGVPGNELVDRMAKEACGNK